MTSVDLHVVEAHREIRIQREPFGPKEWSALTAEFMSVAVWDKTSNVLWYEEAVGACVLERRKVSECQPRPDAFEGRMFDESTQVRWVVGEGGISAWLVREALDTPGAVAKGEAVSALERQYVLLGLRVDGDSTQTSSRPVPAGVLDAVSKFRGSGQIVHWEHRFPKALFAYPAGLDRQEDRACLAVMEYWRKPPVVAEATTEDDIARALAEPVVCEHRFVAPKNALIAVESKS